MTADFTDAAALAVFCAELVRQGITFHVEQNGDYWVVNLKGF